MRTFHQFMDRHPELALKFGESASCMICDSCSRGSVILYSPSSDEVVISVGCCAQGTTRLIFRRSHDITALRLVVY